MFKPIPKPHDDFVYKCNDCCFIHNDNDCMCVITMIAIDHNLICCENCDEIWTTYTSLLSHCKDNPSHTILFKCDQCEYSTSSPKQLQNHIVYCDNSNLLQLEPKIRPLRVNKLLDLDCARMPILYFIYKLDSDNNYTHKCKIGYTSNTLKSRLSGLQVGNDQLLKAYNTIYTEHAHEWEKYLHGCLNDKHIRGEWYHVSPQELDIIINIITPIIHNEPTRLI